jgi:hypothetical protein
VKKLNSQEIKKQQVFKVIPQNTSKIQEQDKVHFAV